MSTQQEQYRYTFNELVASNVRVGAAFRHMNQSQLAKAMGISQSTLALRWWGKRPYTLDDLEIIATIFGVMPWELTQPINENGGQPRLTAVYEYTARDLNPEPSGYGFLEVASLPLATVTDIGSLGRLSTRQTA